MPGQEHKLYQNVFLTLYSNRGRFGVQIVRIYWYLYRVSEFTYLVGGVLVAPHSQKEVDDVAVPLRFQQNRQKQKNRKTETEPETGGRDVREVLAKELAETQPTAKHSYNNNMGEKKQAINKTNKRPKK